MLFFSAIARAVAVSIYNHEADFFLKAGISLFTNPHDNKDMWSLYEASHDVMEQTELFDLLPDLHYSIDSWKGAA